MKKNREKLPKKEKPPKKERQPRKDKGEKKAGRDRRAERNEAVSIAAVEKPKVEDLFNATSNRVHGYSSRLSRYLRLSISFRASLGYSWLLLRMLVTLALVLAIGYGILQAPNYRSRQQEALELMPTPEITGVEAVLLSADQVPEGRFDEDGFMIWDGWGVHWDTDPFRIRLSYREAYGDGQALLLFDLMEDWRVLKGLMVCLGVMGLLLIIAFMTDGKKLNAKLLRPIGEITETAQMMGEQNLSARINVAGTQNELRDLAVVINDMLARIEVAYNRQKQFVSDASHELRTPIAVIQGYAGLLERWGKDNPDVRDEAIAAITSETQSMKELVENLLFLARHDKKTLRLSMEPFESGDMLRELVKETALIAKEHHILAGEIAEAPVIADRSSVKQAVRVFVDNAVKYTPPGGSVEISSKLKGDALLITIADSGPGIKRADLERIFDRFFRADEARNSQTGGHGLGLAIARIIAVSHGGRIHARSQPGVGSEFTLEIPTKVVAPEEEENDVA